MLSPIELLNVYEDHFKNDSFRTDPKGLYDPARHIMSMKSKKIRPLLCLAACNLYQDDVSASLPAAHAIEIFHNFTLVHDDIMDAADLRRGIETVHKKYGINKAILAGDVMFSFSYEYLLSLNESVSLQVIKEFNKTAIQIFEGQQYDMDFETRDMVSIHEYIEMISFKTSVLLACALKMGALVGGANAADQAAIYEFGLNLGLAFQIKDDYLDAYGDPAVFGKKAGGDIIQNKKTYLYLSAINNADEELKSKLLQLRELKDESQKIKETLEIFDQLNIPVESNEAANVYYEKSLSCLDQVSVSSDRKKVLLSLAKNIQERTF